MVYKKHERAMQALYRLMRKYLPEVERGYDVRLSDDGVDLIIRPYVLREGEKKFFGQDIVVTPNEVLGENSDVRSELEKWIDFIKEQER